MFLLFFFLSLAIPTLYVILPQKSEQVSKLVSVFWMCPVCTDIKSVRLCESGTCISIYMCICLSRHARGCGNASYPSFSSARSSVRSSSASTITSLRATCTHRPDHGSITSLYFWTIKERKVHFLHIKKDLTKKKTKIRQKTRQDKTKTKQKHKRQWKWDKIATNTMNETKPQSDVLIRLQYTANLSCWTASVCLLTLSVSGHVIRQEVIGFICCVCVCMCVSVAEETCLLIFAVGLFSDVLGLLELDLLYLHLLLILQSSVLNDLHASGMRKQKMKWKEEWNLSLTQSGSITRHKLHSKTPTCLQPSSGIKYTVLVFLSFCFLKPRLLIMSEQWLSEMNGEGEEALKSWTRSRYRVVLCRRTGPETERASVWANKGRETQPSASTNCCLFRKPLALRTQLTSVV